MSAFTVETYESESLWLAKRPEYIGASEVSIAMGLSPFRSPYSLWAEKTGRNVPVRVESEAMKWGKYLEEPIAAEYQNVTGRVLIDYGRYTILRSKEYPFLTCTLDREIVKEDDRGSGALEIKSTGFQNADDWIEEPPIHVQAQLQAQLLVTGWTWGAIAVLVGGQKFRRSPDLKRHQEFLSLMVEKCTAFWKLVESDTPPEIDGSESTQRALAAMYPEDNGEAIPLPLEADEWDRDYQQAHAEMTAAEERKRAAMNKIIAAMGEASYGVLPGAKWSNKIVHRKGYTVEPKEFRLPRRLANGER